MAFDGVNGHAAPASRHIAAGGRSDHQSWPSGRDATNPCQLTACEGFLLRESRECTPGLLAGGLWVGFRSIADRMATNYLARCAGAQRRLDFLLRSGLAPKYDLAAKATDSPEHHFTPAGFAHEELNQWQCRFAHIGRFQSRL